MQWHNETQIQINSDIALPTFRLTEFLVRPSCSREHTTGTVRDAWTVQDGPVAGQLVIHNSQWTIDLILKPQKGNFSCLEGFLVLRRRISYYFIHMFIPSTLCVIVSWTSFWIKAKFLQF